MSIPVKAEEQTAASVAIQREAHQLVDSLKRRFPEARFTFVLSNEDEAAALVARNLERLMNVQQIERELRSTMEDHQQAEEKRGKILETLQKSQEELQSTMDKVRKLYLLLGELKQEKEALTLVREEIQKNNEQARQEKEKMIAEVAHYRSVVRRMQQALEEVPEFISPQRVFRYGKDSSGQEWPVAISDSSTSGRMQE